MNYEKLSSLNIKDLKEFAKKMDLPIVNNRQKLIDSIIDCFKEYEKYKTKKIDKYERKHQLGEKGKEGTTYLVINKKNGKEFAMKTFNSKKSSKTLRKEAELQQLASEYDAAPKVIEIDTVSKYIVMEKMDKHLFDVMKKQNGDLTKSQQKQIIDLFNRLDEAKVFHADSNILNYMIRGKKILLIDYGFSKYITPRLENSLKTSTPNKDIMTIGLILKLKELKAPESSYQVLKTNLAIETQKRFNI